MVKVSGALVAALIALFGVLLTGVINTYIAEQSRKLTAELEEQRAQEVASYSGVRIVSASRATALPSANNPP